MIPYGKKDINQIGIYAVVSELRFDFLTQGPKGLKFERAILP